MPDFICEFCGEPVDTTSPSVFRRVLAWVPNKKSAPPTLPSDPVGWAHFGCIEIEKRNPIERNSASLF